MHSYIIWNNNDLKSIKKAERKKTTFENKGYVLEHYFINGLTGDCTLTYRTSLK